MVIRFVLLLLSAYLLGAVPAAYLAGKWARGIDIREYGSGNMGASNLLRLTSVGITIPVIIFDLVKGMIPVWLARLLGLDIGLQVAIGLAAICGHNWPVYLGFSGGRGLLTTLGVAFILPVINSLIPWEIVVFLAVAGILLFTIHDMALGTGLGAVFMPLVSWGFGEPLAMTLGFLAMLLLMIIRRLTAPKTTCTASVSRRELLVNRLLFDRDIRDKEAWVNRQPLKQEEGKRKG
jgi:glycerol-3-phosphate acyltransferase PlsY